MPKPRRTSPPHRTIPASSQRPRSRISSEPTAAETGDDLPAYAHPAAGWDDFLNDDTPVGESSAEASEPDSDGDGADAGSIRDLLDRVKTEVGGDVDDPDLEDDSNGGAAAAG